MNRRILWIAFFLLVAGGAASYFLGGESVSKNERMKLSSATPTATQQPDTMTPQIVASDGASESLFVIAPADKDQDKHKEDIYKMFQADERGNLVLSEKTRLNIESLYALNTPEELEEKLRKLSAVLPPTAHRQLVHLIDYWGKYIETSTTIYDPGKEMTSIDEALKELQGLHELRVSYFGADVAEAFFAEEEKMNRELFELMRLDKDPNITTEEKVHRAQLLIQSKRETEAAKKTQINQIK